jgi:hypothetical protein
MANKANTLTCAQCGYANESERVYCHNCGTKLDRSLLPVDPENKESLDKKQKRIRRAVTPRRGFFAGAGKTFIYTMLWSVLVAVLVQAARAPDGVPKPLDKDKLLDVRQVNLDLEDATQSPVAKTVTLTTADINGYLQYRIKSKSTGLIGDEVKFLRVFVTLDEGVIRITTEQSIFDRPVYGTSYYKLSIKDGKLAATNVGGNFGRLMIHPELMKYVDGVFQNLWDALSSEKRLLDKFQSIEVHKDHIDLVSKPGAV